MEERYRYSGRRFVIPKYYPDSNMMVFTVGSLINVNEVLIEWVGDNGVEDSVEYRISDVNHFFRSGLWVEYNKYFRKKKLEKINSCL